MISTEFQVNDNVGYDGEVEGFYEEVGTVALIYIEDGVEYYNIRFGEKILTNVLADDLYHLETLKVGDMVMVVGYIGESSSDDEPLGKIIRADGWKYDVKLYDGRTQTWKRPALEKLKVYLKF